VAGDAVPARRGRLRETYDIAVTAVRGILQAHLTDVAASLAYYAFLAIPATLLVAAGVFGLFAGDTAIQDLLDRLDGVVPEDALTLIEDSLTRITSSSQSGLGLAAVGLIVALWTSVGAMSALMRGLNRVHGCEETRSFPRQRLTAFVLLAWSLVAVILSFGLLVLGAPLSESVGEALGAESLVSWLWWALQWPILILGLLTAVTAILRAGPACSPPRIGRELTGAGVAVFIWLVASGGFAIYASRFGHYGAAWGALSAVIVLLTWLWLSALAILIGARVEVEVAARRGP
jgi:membrane protein